jgi:DNA polymerase III delta prime subunit
VTLSSEAEYMVISEAVKEVVQNKHIDTRYHFTWDLIEDGYIKIVFVKSCGNVTDPMFLARIRIRFLV